MDSKQPRLMDQVRECLRYKHYSFATEKCMCIGYAFLFVGLV